MLILAHLPYTQGNSRFLNKLYFGGFMLTPSQLVELNKLGIELKAILAELESQNINANDKKRLIERKIAVYTKLADQLPANSLEDPDFMDLLMQPLKPHFDIDRTELGVDKITEWLAVKQTSQSHNDVENATLKLLLFFGSTAAVSSYENLHTKYLNSQKLLNCITNTQLKPQTGC